MQRVTVLLIFSTLVIVVLNLKSGQNLQVDKSFFNEKKYSESYHGEQELISKLSAPKVEEEIVEEVVRLVRKAHSDYVKKLAGE